MAVTRNAPPAQKPYEAWTNARPYVDDTLDEPYVDPRSKVDRDAAKRAKRPGLDLNTGYRTDYVQPWDVPHREDTQRNMVQEANLADALRRRLARKNTI